MVDHRVTGKDVARAAGVTTATVSNVLNGKRNVGEQTRERVLAVVRELGYVPDQTAKSLRKRTSRCIGVVIEKNLSNPRYGRTVEGMLRAADARGYRITLCRNHRAADRPCDDYLRAYFERQVDAVIFVSRDTEGPRAESVELIERERVPFVALDCPGNPSQAYSTIDFDYFGGARDVVACAIRHGAKRVVYLRPDVRNVQEEQREEGVRAACAEAGRARPLVFRVKNDILFARRSERDRGEVDSDTFAQPSQAYMRSLSNELSDLAAGRVHAGDAVISSWAGWSNVVSRLFPLPGVIFADLASDYLSTLGTEIFSEMPNYEAGERAVEEAVALIEGAAPTAQVLPLRCCDLIGAIPATAS